MATRPALEEMDKIDACVKFFKVCVCVHFPKLSLLPSRTIQ